VSLRGLCGDGRERGGGTIRREVGDKDSAEKKVSEARYCSKRCRKHQKKWESLNDGEIRGSGLEESSNTTT